MFKIKSLDHIAIKVTDVEASAVWYQETLGLKRMEYEEAWGKIPLMMFSESNNGIALFPVTNPPIRARSGLMHFAFLVDREDFIAAQEELTKKGIAFVFQDHRATHSIYLHDPDGYEVEITTYTIDWKG